MSGKDLLVVINKELEELQAIDVSSINVEQLTTITDVMIVCSGRSTKHVKAIAEHLIDKSKHLGFKALSQSGFENGEWALIDFGDIVVHIMIPDVRAFYNLEGLWQQPPTDKIIAS
jgi:ribosome-associated protein